MNKIQVYHFHNGHEGGVLSVIKNLLQFSSNPLIENHIIYTINKDLIKEYPVKNLKGAVTEKVLYYSPCWNFYNTSKQLAKLLPDDKAIIVAHDWIELGMASNLGLQNPLVQIVHGNYDYYYDLAIRHRKEVDVYVCVSNKIYDSLQQKLAIRKNDIFNLHFPVPGINPTVKMHHALQLIYYVGNLKDVNKQFSTIVEIANLLGEAATDYFFTIAGGGMTTQEFFDLWPATMKNRVNYKGVQTNEEIIEILPGQDIFLLPSLAEGLPVSLVEAMKAGAVPLVTNWNGGVDELITQGVSGFYFNNATAVEYATCIKNLKANKNLLKQLSNSCIERANALFDPEKNTKAFECLYLKIADQIILPKKKSKVYGSRLDHPLIPNFITKIIRRKK